jgi:uncharacterized membrane protein
VNDDQVGAPEPHEHAHEQAHEHEEARGHGHSHAHVDLAVSKRVRMTLDVVAIVIAAATVIGMLAVNANRDPVPTSDSLPSDVYRAMVTSVELGSCGEDIADGVECRIVTFELRAGPDRGESRTLYFGLSQSRSQRLHTGDRIMVAHTTSTDPAFDYQYADRQRQPTLFWLALVFALAVVVLGRWRGVAALAGLIASFMVILRFALPALLSGSSPVVVAVLAAVAIAYLALYLAHGINPLTTVALLGTVVALGLTIVLSAVFTAAAHFSGFASEDASRLQSLLGADVDIVGLLLAGAVIGALGALDDMTVTQASAVAELHSANPDLSARELYRRGLRIGRDHISSTVNTLALAYLGASLPTFLIFTLSEQSLGTIVNSEVVAVEIVRTLVGSIGLIAAVPITTALAAFVVRAGIHETGRHAH